MAKRAGEFVHYGATTLISGLQTVGPDNINVPNEQVFETGNDSAVQRLFDTPDLSFTLESQDMTTATERMLLRAGPTAVPGRELDLKTAKPLDIVGPWKKAKGDETVEGGTIVPYLYVSDFTVRAGVSQTATKQYTLKGDSAYFVPGGSPRYEEFTKAGPGPYSFADTALKTEEGSETRYALCVTVHRADGTWRRLLPGAAEDYTDNASGFTLTTDAADEFDDGDTIVVTYGTAVQDEILDTVHPDPDLHPRAFKYYNVVLYISDGAATPTLKRWRGVQQWEANWRVQLDRDLELGNRHVVDQDYDTPEVTGSISMRPRDGAYLIEKIAEINGADPEDVQNIANPVPLEMECQFLHPRTGDVVATYYCEDARITVPGIQVRARQKQDVSFPWYSDSGDLRMYEGERAA